MSKSVGESSHFDKKHFAEDVGLMFEQEGMPRMAGRILGWLLISEAPQVALQELAEILTASQGSISTMTRLLIQFGLVERVGLPGHRRDYVRIKSGVWSQLLQAESAKVTALRELAERGLDMLAGKRAPAREHLLEIREWCEFLEEEYPLILERWEKRRKAQAR